LIGEDTATEEKQSEAAFCAVAARSIAERLAEILERHRRRSWMPGDERLARLVRELEELEIDLRSLSTPASMLDKVHQAATDLRAIAGSDPLSAAEKVVESLLESIGKPGAPVANDPSRRDEPFWR
jgi:hypothetical protein